MSSSFYEILVKRRSNYSLDSKLELAEPAIIELINHAVKHSPSAFNSQSARVLILFNQHHQKFWDLTLEELKKVTPPAHFSNTTAKINSFAAARGTILFFEDKNIIQGLQHDYPLYQDKFPVWSEQSNGMLQFAVWSLLAENNIGASLQHYSPLADTFVHQEWEIPTSWKLIAQMPFGHIAVMPDPKDFLPLEARVKIFS